MTVFQILSDALQELNVIGPGDELEDDDAQTALRYFQMMVDTFQGDGLMLFTANGTPLPLVASQQTYTVGPGGNLNVIRPVYIPHIGVVPSGQTYEIPVVPYSNREEWQSEPWKAQTDLYPTRFLYEPKYPLANLIVWPVPTTAAVLQVYLPTPLTTPASLTTLLVFPPTYYECYHTNLVVRLAPAFQTTATKAQETAAMKAMGRVQRLNDPGPPLAKFDPAITGRGGWDITSGRYRA